MYGGGTMKMKYNEAKQIYKDFVFHKISTNELWDMLDEYFDDEENIECSDQESSQNARELTREKVPQRQAGLTS